MRWGLCAARMNRELCASAVDALNITSDIERTECSRNIMLDTCHLLGVWSTGNSVVSLPNLKFVL